MQVYKILDELEAEIEKSARIPLTDKVVIRDEVLYGYIDKMRANVPEDMRTGQWIKKERDRILEDAETEARDIVEHAKTKVVEIADETEIIRIAEQKSNEMLESARSQSQEMIQGALEYADQLMATLEEKLAQNLEQIKEGRSQIQMSSKQVD